MAKPQNYKTGTRWSSRMSNIYVSFVYFIVQEHTKIAGAFAEGSEVNNVNKLLQWFTYCPKSNNGSNTFELCIAGHDGPNGHRVYYDKEHR